MVWISYKYGIWGTVQSLQAGWLTRGEILASSEIGVKLSELLKNSSSL
jgi:hypothetical protein